MEDVGAEDSGHRLAADALAIGGIEVTGTQLLRRLDRVEGTLDSLAGLAKGQNLDVRLRLVEDRLGDPRSSIDRAFDRLRDIEAGDVDRESRLRTLERYAWSLPTAMLTSIAAVIVAVVT